MCNHLATNSKTDPTQTAGNRKRVINWMYRQAKGALTEVKRYAESVPRKQIAIQVNKTQKAYSYDLNGFDPYLAIDEIINRWFETDSELPAPRWFFGMEVDNVTRRATTIESERVNTLAETAGLTQQYQIEQVLLSDPYRERIRRVRQRVFEEMKGFTGDTANDLARTLSNEMAAGNGINEVKRKLAKRFNIKMKRSETIARTELGTAHRNARRDTSKDARDRLGLNTMVQLISSLSPTTRPSHAKLHLKVVAIEEVEPLYQATPGQRINCICSEQTVIITKSGEIIGKRKETERDKKLAAYLANTPVSAR